MYSGLNEILIMTTNSYSLCDELQTNVQTKPASHFKGFDTNIHHIEVTATHTGNRIITGTEWSESAENKLLLVGVVLFGTA